jgi:hypothetical protein
MQRKFHFPLKLRSALLTGVCRHHPGLRGFTNGA